MGVQGRRIDSEFYVFTLGLTVNPMVLSRNHQTYGFLTDRVRVECEVSHKFLWVALIIIMNCFKTERVTTSVL